MNRLSNLRSPSDDEKAASELEAATPSNFALGVERIGLAGLRFSLLSVVIVAVLAVVAVFGVLRIKVDDSLN
jgi:predicted RND superfamily exporter protein